METRIFTVIDSSTQTTKKINSTAETVDQLKRELSNAGFSLDGKVIQEGLTRSELKDGGLLPHDVPYKGTVTNNLVFRLSKAQKNIKSGSYSRADLYEFIKTNGLQEQVKSYCGRNYTQVPTDKLLECYNSLMKEEAPEKVATPEKTTTVSAPTKENLIEELNSIKKEFGNIKKEICMLAGDMINYLNGDVEDDTIIEAFSHLAEITSSNTLPSPKNENTEEEEDLDTMFAGM